MNGAEPNQKDLLRRNFLWTLVGSALYAVSQWAILVILARLGGPTTVGRFSLGLSITAPVMLLSNLNLRAIQATDARSDYTFGDYFGLRLVTSVLALALVGVITTYPRRETATTLVVLAVGILKTIESLSDVAYGLLQKHEVMDLVSISMVLRGLGLAAAVSAGLALTKDLLVGLCFGAAAWLLVFLFFDLRFARRFERLSPRFRRGQLRRLVRLSLPLGIVMMLISLNANVAVYFVEHAGGEASVGFFSPINYLVFAGFLVVEALGRSASPRLAQHLVAGERRAFWRLQWRLVAAGVAMGSLGALGAVTLGKLLLTIVYGERYAAHHSVLTWLMVASIASYASGFLGFGFTAARRLAVQIPTNAVTLGVNVALCAILVPRYGILGAAWAACGAAGARLVVDLGLALSAWLVAESEGTNGHAVP